MKGASMRVFIANHGQPNVPLGRRRDFHLPGLRQPIPLDGQVEIDDALLVSVGREPGTAEDFATFICGVYNANHKSEWLSVVVDKPKKKAE